jgi:hypothetical protein
MRDGRYDDHRRQMVFEEALRSWRKQTMPNIVARLRSTIEQTKAPTRPPTG